MPGCTLYMNCGNDGNGASPNFRTFDSACTAAAYACGSDGECARDYIVRSMFLVNLRSPSFKIIIQIITMVSLNGVQIDSMF